MLRQQPLYISAALILVLIGSLFAVNLGAAQDATPEATPETQSTGAPFLGISAAESPDGVLVGEVVADGPAAAAGLQVGDVITAINDEAVTVANIRDVLGTFAVGDTVTLSVTRDGKTLSLEATLAERPQEATSSSAPNFEFNMPNPRMMEALGLGLRLDISDQGVAVSEVIEGSPAAAAGFEVGDVITKVGDTNINRPMDVMRALRNLDLSQPLAVQVQRDGTAVSLELNLEDFAKPSTGQGQSFGMPFSGMMVGGGARLGVAFVMLDADVAKEHQVEQTEGALITEVVSDSPAATAGLEVNDIVTAVDGDQVDVERTLRDRLLAYEPGDTVTLSVLRDGAAQEIEATLDEAGFQGMMPGMPFGEDGLPFVHPPLDVTPEAPNSPGA
ncbi:MAG TPA: PDZ domain-containing protein [Phototrophicaceae bacterium]|nr:PDZ domain-containing protein [Phototrophicaceae bacterium]